MNTGRVARGAPHDNILTTSSVRGEADLKSTRSSEAAVEPAQTGRFGGIKSNKGGRGKRMKARVKKETRRFHSEEQAGPRRRNPH
jgi:hypothetical protein